jgi:hypothetical protein
MREEYDFSQAEARPNPYAKLPVLGPATDWAEDCLAFWGKILTGKYGHWCDDWDYLPIDETCDEFDACHCVFEGYE